MKKAILVLSDNSVYCGLGVGACGSFFGELVFHTAMTGYVESLTDPSFARQILLFSYPLIGNYGVRESWFESSQIHPRAIVATEIDSTLGQTLETHRVGGIAGVDTRAIVKKIRAMGTMSAVVSVFENDDRTMPVHDVTTKQTYVINPTGDKTVALIDYGAKKSIMEELAIADLRVVVFSALASTEEILHVKPLGIVLSNGPGDPSLLTSEIATIKKLLLTKLPIFGICLGHQLLGLALEAATYKLPFGHRGVNQPVLHISTGKAFFTSQNHSYAISADSLPHELEITFTNLIDGSIEGMRHKRHPWSSVQFHPEGNPGPLDTHFLFDDFLRLL